MLRRQGDAVTRRPDVLAVEEPLELRVAGNPLTITMRTPGADMDLAAGFLVAEGSVHTAADIATMRYCQSGRENGPNNFNVLDLDLRVPAPPPRAFLTSSACGVCGSASIEGVESRSWYDVAADHLRIDLEVLRALPSQLRAAQSVFDKTGGLHAAGLFGPAGELLCLREDVGRHNAVDKVVGWALREGLLPLSGRVLLVSGRASFELVQKAWMAGIPMLAAVSAPSSLAVDLAAKAGITLIGFLRGDSMNVYTAPERVVQ